MNTLIVIKSKSKYWMICCVDHNQGRAEGREQLHNVKSHKDFGTEAELKLQHLNLVSPYMVE